MPMLTVILNVKAPYAIGVFSTSARIFSARHMAASAVVEGASIMNSSPPKRAHMSEVRVLFFKMVLTVCRATSPV